MQDIDTYKTAHGEDIVLCGTDDKDVAHPFAVYCFDADGECRWDRFFKTEAEARVEYERWRS